MKKKTLKELVGPIHAIKYVESLDDSTTVLTHSVNGMTHYIITETYLEDKEAKEVRIKEQKEQLEECNAQYEQRIERCELNMYECEVELDFDKSYYWQRRRDQLIEEFNVEQNKLIKQLDKLTN